MRNSLWLCFVVVILFSCKKDEENHASGLRNGLLAFYPFNGNVIDESGNNYHLKINNASLTKDYFSKDNKAIGFNGVDASLEIPALLKATNLTNFTISLWSKPKIQIDNRYYSLLTISGNGGIKMSLGKRYNGTFSFNSLVLPLPNGFGAIPVYQSIDTSTDQWVHLVLGQNTDELFLYINGVKAKPFQREPSSISFTDGGHIGCNYLQSSVPELEGRLDFYEGVLDNIRIYNRALSPKEIEYLFSRKD